MLLPVGRVSQPAELAELPGQLCCGVAKEDTGIKANIDESTMPVQTNCDLLVW